MYLSAKRYLLQLAVYILVSIASAIAAPAGKVNTFSSASQSVTLSYWQISKDFFPDSAMPDVSTLPWQLFAAVSEDSVNAYGNWFMQTRIVITDSGLCNQYLGVFPKSFSSAYEIYWDGEQIGSNGMRGAAKEQEVPGISDQSASIPQRLLAPGEHVLLLRLSDHHHYSNWKWYYGGIILGRYEYIAKEQMKSGFHAFFIAGILFITFLFNLFLFFTRRKITFHLIFSAICFQVVLDFVFSQIATVVALPATFVHIQYNFYQLNTFLFAILFPVFFVYVFALPKKLIPVIAAVVLIVFYFFTNIWNVFTILSGTVLVLSSLLIAWAVYKQAAGSKVMALGLVLSWAAYYYNLAFEGLATVMVVCTSFFIAQQFAQTERKEQAARLRSAHLENELLKKNINPHFLLNTLTSIIVWLRRDTASAIQLIEALAEEFRMINQISAQKLIPVTQELALCKSHLRIMGFRKGAEYTLETCGIDEQETVPPMIFHTLVENGLTHGYEQKTTGTFSVTLQKDKNIRIYTIANDGDFNPADSKGSTGFGEKYIKARLEESYPGNWKYTSGATEFGWQTIIEIGMPV